MAKSFTSFVKGLLLRGETSDPSDNLPGSMWHNSSSGRMKAYVESAIRTIVSENQTQTLTNKSLDADANTITNIDNADIKAGAAIDATKIADGSVTSAEFQYLGGVTSDIQTQLNAKVTAGSSTDNAIARFDGTAGSIQNSTATISDVGTLAVPEIVTDGLFVNGEVAADIFTNVRVSEPTITVNNSGNDAGAEGAGLIIDRTGVAGSLVYENALASKFKAGALGSEVELVNVSGTQTLSGKTNAQNIVFDVNGNRNIGSDSVRAGNVFGNSTLDFTEISTPSTPSSGHRRLYSKADGWYELNSSGVESKLTAPGATHLSVKYTGSSTNYWSKTGGSYGDFTVSGTIPAPTTINNAGFGAISKATSDLPGINFSAPRTGTIKCTATVVIVPSQSAGTTAASLKLIESTTVTDIAFNSLSVMNNNILNLDIPMTLVGYFNVTASTVYNFKMQGAVSQGTLFIGAQDMEIQLAFAFEYIS